MIKPIISAVLIVGALTISTAPATAANPAPTSSYTCGDGIDNDGDGGIDYADWDAKGPQPYDSVNGCDKIGPESSCLDGIDNDADNKVDMNDVEVRNGSPIKCDVYFNADGGSCGDGIDHDGDGFTDHADEDYTTRYWSSYTYSPGGRWIEVPECDNYASIYPEPQTAPVAQPAPSITRGIAISQARKYLSRRFKSYRHGTARKLQTVRISTTKMRVQASWRYRAQGHRKTLLVTNTDHGYTVR